MPHTEPFAALRYSLDHIADLSDVVAPPYDVIDPELQDSLYKRHPANVVRVILNRDEPGDGDQDRYRRAAGFVNDWIRQGVLRRDDQPAYYVYHQIFDVDGHSHTRRGFMARIRIEPFGSGNVYPHEETHPKAKVDRLKLTTATRQNNSQIFGLYPDTENEIIQSLDAAAAAVTPVVATDHLGVVHKLWAVTDSEVIAEVSGLMADKPMFVADGHHRYETASNYRDQIAAQLGAQQHAGQQDGILPAETQQNATLPADHPANFVMTMLVGMSDPGMLVLPTHRLLRQTPAFSAADLIAKLSDCFECQTLDGGIDAAAAAWSQMESTDRQDQLALYAAGDPCWVMARAKPAAAQRMAVIAAGNSDDWRQLGVSLLHRLVIDDLLGCAGHPKPTYVHEIDEVIAGLKGQGTAAESEGDSDYTLAALVMPAKLSHVEAISLHKERMPAKSTYFYPKLLSGLCFNPLED
ncbi:MAG: DUF1015 domain-containing protein [Planctomycetota bacterium]